MNYIHHKGDIYNTFLKINNIDSINLDTSRFLNYPKNQEPILSFKETLLSLKDKKFLIVGDYDCDGITSTTILCRLFDYLNIKHNYYIPSRSKEGYGLNERIVHMAKDNNFDVILTVDNGVVSDIPNKLALDLGMKLLIIDHHEYINKPICTSYIHPNLLEKEYSKLSAGGLSYLLSSYFYEDELSLVYGGLSILSDMVGVLDFNRYLVKEMMKVLNKDNVYTLKLLNDNKKLDYDSLSFNVIPKINAISRMDYNPNFLVKYLNGDKDTCLKLINQINLVNNNRKNETSNEAKLAYSMINENDKIIILFSSEFKEGICGLLANRLIHIYNKPCIIFNETDNELKGSARSLEDINIYEYLSKKKDIYDTFGGHGQACGFSLKKDKKEEFLKFINDTPLEVKDISKDVLDIKLEDIDLKTSELLESLKPFGVDLKEPLFNIEGFKYDKKILMANKYPKYIVNNNLSIIDFKNREENFNNFIGYIKKDSYHKGSVSISIEDIESN